jgi:mono/diheme cytochrome c family protein
MIPRKTMAVLTTFLVLGLISTLVILSMLGGVDDYQPTTDDARVIFQEACARCHGERGVGGNADGPKLSGGRSSLEEIQRQIAEGDGRMPRFPNIRGSALQNLTRYVNSLPAPAESSDEGQER